MFKPVGPKILLERLPEPFDNPEVDPESDIRLAGTSQTYVAARALAVGPGFRKDDGTFTPTGVAEGDVCAVLYGAWTSSAPMSEFPVQRRVVRASDVQFIQEPDAAAMAAAMALLLVVNRVPDA